MSRYIPNSKRERLQFENEKKTVWDDLIITFLFGILFIGLVLFCFCPFMY